MTLVAPPAKKQIGSILILILLPLALYFNSLQGSFQFDDRNLIDQKWIADLDAFNKYVSVGIFENRPILLWTFALNNTLHKNKVFGFHLLNLLLHTFVSILIYVVLFQTRRVLGRLPDKGRRTSPGASGNGPGYPPLNLPLFAALLFAVHPLNTDSISYISSRSSVLATFFYLLTLCVFLRIFSLDNNRGRRPMQAGLGLLTAGGIYLAVASKLIAVTLPVLLGLWFLIFIRPAVFPRLGERLFSRKTTAAAASVLGVLLATALLAKPGILYSPKDQGLLLFGGTPYLLVEAKVVIFYYLKLFFAPINLNVDVGFPFTTFFTDPKIALSLLGIAALVYFAWKSENPWALAGVLWFFLTLSPTSSFVPLNDLAVERRMYLPMTLGPCLVAGWAVARIPRGWGVMVVLISLLSLLTLSRNQVWTDEVRLWRDAAGKNPFSSRTHNNLGKAYYEKGQVDQALLHFLTSNENIKTHIAKQYNLANLGRSPHRQTGNQPNGRGEAPPPPIAANLAEPHYNLASVYLDKGNLIQAELEYQTAIRLNPDYFSAHLGLGSVYARMGRVEQAIDSFRQAIRTRKSATGERDYPLARLNLGEIYGRGGKFEDAIRELSLAVKYNPSLVLGHYNLGLARLMTGKLDEAEQSLSACLVLNDRFEPALFNLARVAQARGQWERSTRRFEKFLAVKGADAKAYYQIGWNYQQEGKLDQAVKHFKRALSMKPDFLNARIDLGKIYFHSQKRDLARNHLRKALESNPPPQGAEEISKMLRELS